MAALPSPRYRPGSRTARSSGRRPSAPCAISAVWRRNSSCSGLRQRVRRQRTGRVAGVDAGLLDVLHDAADHHLGAVADAVDVDLDRVVEEAVQQHRRLLATPAPPRACSAPGPCRRARSPSRGRPARSSGAPPAGSRSRAASSQRRALRCARCGSAAAAGRARAAASGSARGLRRCRSMSGEVPMIGTPARFEVERQLQRRLAAVLHDHADAAFPCRRSRARLPASPARSTGGREVS